MIDNQNKHRLRVEQSVPNWQQIQFERLNAISSCYSEIAPCPSVDIGKIYVCIVCTLIDQIPGLSSGTTVSDLEMNLKT